MNKALLCAVAFAFSGAACAVSCGGKNNSSQVSSRHPAAAAGAGGGVACSANTCGVGQYCGSGMTCTSDCTAADGRCGPGESCDSNGQCVALIIDPTSLAVDAGQPADGADACVQLKITFTPQIPTVVMLIDRSGSMVEPFDTGTRWNVLRSALIDPMTGIIPTLQAKVRFGLALYTSDNGFGDTDPKHTCPIITEVPPALNNLTAIAAQYLPDDQKDDTPTGESVDAAVKILDAVTDPGPKVIVLATDGEPDTCDNSDPRGDTELEVARQRSLSAVQNAFKDQVTTFVISVGNEIGDAHLRAVANAGQGLAVDVDAMDRFFRANSQADLAHAFDTIVNGVRSCVLTLNGVVDQTQAGTGSVILDGKPLTYNGPDGWRLNSPSVLELTGASCAAIKSGDHDVAISFPCGAIVPR